MNRKALAVLFSGALIFATSAQAESSDSPDPAAAAADAVIARPLGFAATIVGSVIFVVSLPIAATSRSIDSTARALVLKPAEFTFTRPLGEFGYDGSGADMARSTDRTAKHPRKMHAKRETRTRTGSHHRTTG
jgi:hypothetical protein